MLREPVFGAIHRKAMKPRVGNADFHLFDKTSRQTALEEAEGEIDQVPFTEHFHKRRSVTAVRAYLVVQFYHESDFFQPGFAAGLQSDQKDSCRQ